MPQSDSGESVPRLQLDVETTAEPEHIRAALLDFSDHRPDIWPGLTRDLYEVYSVGETTAEIKEGSRLPVMTAWAKEHYDWSDPATIRWTVVESNFCTPGSYVAATIRPRDGGGSRVHVEWERTGTTFSGKLACRLMVLTKGSLIKKSLRDAFAILERESG